MPSLKLSAPPRRAGQWWPAQAAFMADFAANRYMSGGMEIQAPAAFDFSRASAKHAQDPSGDWHRVEAGLLARSAHGALLEGATTELVHRNTLTGLPPASGEAAFNGGWTRVGASNDFAELLPEQIVRGILTQPFRIKGGTGNNFEGWQTENIPRVSGESYTLSFYARVPEGKAPLDLRWYLPVGLAGAHPIADAEQLGHEWQRFDLTRTATASGESRAQIIKTSVVDASHAVDIALPMLRLGAASSFIPTVGLAQDRAADLLTIPAVTLGIAAGQGTLFHRFRHVSAAGGVVGRVLSLEGASAPDDAIQISCDAAGNGQLALRSGGTVQVQRTYGNLAAMGFTTVGIAWGGGSVRIRFGANAAETVASPSPAGLTALALGSTVSGASPSNGLHRTLVAFGERLGDTQFDAMFETISAGL